VVHPWVHPSWTLSSAFISPPAFLPPARPPALHSSCSLRRAVCKKSRTKAAASALERQGKREGYKTAASLQLASSIHRLQSEAQTENRRLTDCSLLSLHLPSPVPTFGIPVSIYKYSVSCLKYNSAIHDGFFKINNFFTNLIL
jgi:hypothetical protein